MGVSSDLDKGVTFGEADGPDAFIEELGIVVPTFLNPRHDLIVDGGRVKRVNHHVPFKMRGFFKPADWPEAYCEKLRSEVGLGEAAWRTNDEGFVLCAGTSYWRRGPGHNKKGEPLPCKSKAVNRTRFCRAHGGGLHPLDKKMSSKSTIAPPENRVKALDRPAKFLQGFLQLEDLTDEEVQGMFVYNDAGQKVQSVILGVKFNQMMAQELHRRMNRFLQTKTASMLNVMVDIAESELVEPADRINAAKWVAERVLGKTPEVIMHGKIEAPYESIFETIDAGSREDYRLASEASNPQRELGMGGDSDEIVDVEFDEEPDDSEDDEFESESESVEFNNGGESSEADDNSNTGYVGELLDRRSEIERQQEIKKARAKAKQRRFAARATGAATVADMAWLIEWKFIGTGKDSGRFRMKLVCPDDQTFARLARVERSNADAQAAAQQWRSQHVA